MYILKTQYENRSETQDYDHFYFRKHLNFFTILYIIFIFQNKNRSFTTDIYEEELSQSIKRKHPKNGKKSIITTVEKHGKCNPKPNFLIHVIIGEQNKISINRLKPVMLALLISNRTISMKIKQVNSFKLRRVD